MNTQTQSVNQPSVGQLIAEFPRRKARTLRFTSGAPRSAQVIGDGSRALFLRSDGPEDLVTALWTSVIDAAGAHHEVMLADPRELLENADAEDVPAEEKARRERAREGGTGIVAYSVDKAGRCVTFTINGQLFLTEIAEDGLTARTRALAADKIVPGESASTPVLNPRISPDGRHVLYTTGEHLMLVDIAQEWPDDTAAENTAEHAVAAASEEASVAHAHGHRCGDEEAAATPYNPAADRLSTLWSVYPDDATSEQTWKIGLAEFVAGEEMDRYDGFWWGPDSDRIIFESFNTAPEPIWYISDPANPETAAAGRRYPRALTQNADVRLTLAELEWGEHGEYAGLGVQQIAWDHKAYEYVAAVHWASGHDPLILVQNRRQTRDQVLRVVTKSETAADSSAAPAQLRPLGSTVVLEEHANDQWIDIIHGTPAYTPNGRLVCSLNDMTADTNRLTVDGTPFTPAGWNVRRVLDITDTDVLAVVQREPDLAPEVPAAWAENAAGHDARSYDVVSIAFDGTITPVTIEPGSWTASRGARGMIVTGRDMAHAGALMWHATTPSADASAAASVRFDIAAHAAEPGFTPNVHFARIGEHRLYTAIIAPSADSPYAQADTLPVLLKPYGGPGFQQVVASQSYYWDAQWWADQGFLVVTADGRGTTGRGPKWDREIFENMKDITLADQVEAVHALPDAVVALNGTARIPAPNLDKVCMIGWSYGGFLSALAVLDAPGVVKAGCAGAPPTDWTLYDTHYTERYLGLNPDVYAYNGIVQDAPKLTRPLMLIHGFADDNVTIAHSLRLSQALMAAGRPHTFLPLTGITHMTNDETVAENLLILQRDFLYDALDLR
ncbi:Xaa-Pro dipeptidase [Bifidobacterium goeldii]|uniref:Xaa-Pro dipeptidase n=1 Tax=Bifidobacterium goeldii TaxID=2306975 RepID=A0A430FHD4_9BIFI|nr:prolyl oligopeptidase family serine peptidase [Bifidobacterium goeldii]RSX52220.1 Xaa-Pro dipeptidase [Bifidobacterium goeldii]